MCIVVGVAWLLLLPLNDYSRQTYVSENAILPGQVHTYFGGSEHNVFRAFRQEMYDYRDGTEEERNAGIGRIMRESGLKVAEQPYTYHAAGEEVTGTNVYGILQGPRADATEAMVIMAGWKNFEGLVNYSGVALVLTLARYFSRWSIWSKDIIVIVSPESTYGPIAWVDAYHSTAPIETATRNISALPLKAGALQAAVAIDYPVGPWGHRFDKIDIQYDGLNGALPNLDLLNTVVSVASGQMNIGCSLHGISSHKDTYEDRLRTIAAGLATQSLGHATGPHSAFMPYHIDAITLRTMGDGWHDEMSLGRVTESVTRSINNLLEHLHQSFFFYILLNSNRFVSIGNYLPAAMLIAGSFTISALALWVQSGRAPLPEATPAQPSEEKRSKLPKMELVHEGGDVALVPKPAMRPVERQLFLPALTLLGIHLASFIPLYLLTHLSKNVSGPLTLRFSNYASANITTTVSPTRPPHPHSPNATHATPPRPPPQNPPPRLAPTPPSPAITLPPPPRRGALHPRHAKFQPGLRGRPPNRPAGLCAPHALPHLGRARCSGSAGAVAHERHVCAGLVV